MRIRTLTAVAAFAIASPLQAQGIMNDFHADLNDVQSKTLQLANAIPESAYDWTPGPGVRTVREVFMHIAADNYLIPIAMGKAAPAATKIVDYNTSVTYEKQKLTKAQVIAELTASFTHVHQGLALTTDSNLGEKIKLFGSDFTRGRAAILLVTHLHEHLGQTIAYARANKIVPPWSK
jgi:uncharacterized damage-inducible protein DinB